MKGGILNVISQGMFWKILLSPRAMAGAVLAMIMNKKLEILHMVEESRRFDHLQSLLHGGLLCHLR